MPKWEEKEKKKLSRQETLKKGILAVVFCGILAAALLLFLQSSPFSRTSDGAELLLGQTLEQASQTLDFRTAEYSEDGGAEEYTLIMPAYRQTMRFSDGICTGLRWEYWEFSGALDRMRELSSVLSGQYEASGQDTLSPYLETESSLSPPDPETVPQMAWNLPEANGGGTLVLSLRAGEADSFFVELSVQEP